MNFFSEFFGLDAVSKFVEYPIFMAGVGVNDVPFAWIFRFRI